MKKYLKEKPSFGLILVLVIFIALVYVGTILFLKMSSNELRNDIKRNLNEISSQNVNILKTKIEKDIALVDSVAYIASEQENVNNETVRNYINEIESVNPDVKIYVADSKGNGVDENGNKFNISNKDFFLAANRADIQDRTVQITDQAYFSVTGPSIIYIRTIIKLEFYRAGIVMAVFPTDVYDDYMETQFYNGEGYSYIIKSTGEAVSAKFHPEAAVEINNKFGFSDSQAFKSIKGLENLSAELAAGSRGIMTYELTGEDKYLCYDPIGVNDWYLLSVIPESVADSALSSIVIRSLILSTVIIIAFTAFYMWVIIFRSKKRREIKKYAYEDILTGVNNWTYMVQYSKKLIDTGTSYAFVVFDINRFKLINDIYGYNYGDTLLKNVATTMTRYIDENEVISRISGDIFAMLLRFTSESELTTRLEKIFKEICGTEQKKMDQNATYKMTFSCGVCPIDDKALSITAAMDRANMAKNIAKGYYLGNIAFYNEKIKRNMVEEQEIENSMNRAITNEEFEVYLQPQYKLNTETISGAEALIRWNHPQKGLLSPGRFIPIFENNGFIVKLDYYVFEHVCKKLREWLDEGKPPISIAVNMSRHHIMEEKFVKNLVDIANKYKIQTSNLEIELTENIFFENQDAIVSVMSQLKDAGFKLSMDDFGSGYSSLNLLTEIPVDVIKIDREFFKAFETNIKSKKVVSMVIKLVRDLKMKVIAEGVETIEQVLFLKAIECDIVQGYYFAKPMPLDQFEKLAYGDGKSEKNVIDISNEEITQIQ